MVLAMSLSSTSLNPSIEYLFKVSSLSPQQGSLYGGTKITLTGDGFSTNPQENKVLLGSIPCTVTSSSETMLHCVTQSIANTQIVTNGGKHRVYGLGYAWSPSTLEVSVGDRVQWQWDAPPAVQGIGYRVFSVSSPGDTSYDGSGFTSGNVKTSSGSFSYQFTLPGVYFYSSGFVSDSQTIFMQGAVKVKQLSRQKSRLHLSIGGTEATYNPGSSENLPLPGSNCITQDPGCSQSSNDDKKDNSFVFTFLSCYSPSITSISPSRGPASDLLTITGTGFSNITCANEVTIGDYPCVVMSSTASSLTCYIDPRDTMPIWVPKMVSLTVHNMGTAINTAHQELDRRFVLLPHIESVMPNTGSLNGRTRLTIHGSGFSGSQNNITVKLAAYECAIVSANYTDITCDTPPSSVAKTIPVDVVVLGIPAQCRGACNFSYSGNLSLSVSSASPTTLQNISTELLIQGEGFGSSVQDILVYIGNIALPAMTVTNQNITCIVGPLPAGDYVLAVVVLSKGLATGSVTLNSPAVATLSPTSGSVMGGTTLFITGNGFDINNTRVTIDYSSCQIVSVTPGEVQCTTAAHYAATTAVIIWVNGIQYPQLTFTFRQDDTPSITAVNPSTGSSGTLLTITGTGFGINASAISVTIGDVSCDITTINDTELLCTVGSHAGGIFPVELYDLQRGNAQTSAYFTYELSIQSVSPGQGSFGGGLVLTVSGSGFDALTSSVFVCDVPCTVDILSSTSSLLFCEVPPGNGNGTLQNCDVRVDNPQFSVQLADAFNYSSALTPLVTSIYPKRGGTAGGTRLTITGSGFSSDLGSVNVTIAGTVCDVQSVASTQVICITNGHSPSGHVKVKVNIEGQGIANLDNADFFYIDVWSSNFTWGGESPPDEGFLAVITQGQYILLDVNTPVLKMLLIQGGTLVFDEADIELQSEYILITDGGVLQIGTSAAPFQHKAIITLHGNLRSPELPLYGAKTLAVREGILELHGLPIPVTWTRLAETAEAGASTIILENAVTWKSGDEIVIASTGDRKSQMQNEKMTISSISLDGRNLTLTQPLKYNHLGVTVTLPNGHIFEGKAEVGLLTRNILIRGSDNVEWHDVIPACPDGFDPGEFAVQTCFQGRYGEEIGSDQFGACIMFHAPMPNAQLATGRFEYVEISHAGQAFRLGRHPINWDMTGDLQFTSYVRGCAIHESYNRAIVIKSTHHLLVENNVVYDIMGGALFLEDGVEHGNILQYNLAVFVKQSTSLLNDDITPAAYWITNPNNTVRHNAAAGGTHFGFWYKMYKQQDMPSYDSNICPERTPLGEFNNNTVHSQGWMGLLISENYYPVQGRSCYGNPQPAIFQALTTWNCERGAEWLNGGALQFHQFVMVNNEVFGIHTRNVLRSGIGGWGETQGAVIKNATIVGHLDVLGLNSQYCTGSGIGLPADEGLTISATFVNFDRPGCVAIRLDACNGWDYRFRRMEFFNTSNKASFPCVHAAVLVDLDGTLTGNASQKVIPTMALLDPAHCNTSQEWSFGQLGSVCDSTVSFHRITAYVYQSTISNQFGSISFYQMALLPNANSYYWSSIYGNYPPSFAYLAVFSEFQEGDYLIISHNFTRRPDRFLINDNAERQQYPLDWNSSYHGQFYFNEDTTTLSYIVCRRPNPNTAGYMSSNLDPAVVDSSVYVQIIYCYYKDCIAPPPPPPPPPVTGGTTVQPATTLATTPKPRINGHILWSNRAFWNSSAENGYRYPENGSDVVIPADVQMVADVDIPFLGSLTIYGQLTLPDNVTSNDTTVLPSGYRDIVLNTSYIVIQSGGQLIGGTEDEPFRGCLQIILRGQRSSQNVKLQNDQMLRSKVLAVFGTLELHGIQHTEYRSKISHTALKGSDIISLMDAVGWEVGDDIVITSTSHNAWQTEIRRITNVSLDGTTLSLNESLSYNHTVSTDHRALHTMMAKLLQLSKVSLPTSPPPLTTPTIAHKLANIANFLSGRRKGTGPRDHTSCSGRSCRRLSMFHSIVAVNKSFEIYFSSTSPQKLRLRLLNADDSKAVRVAIFYASPQRLDVYANQVLVSPTNADWTSQNTDYTLLEPSYPGQYLPSLTSSVAGENFFDSEYKMMYVLLRGSTPVEIRTTPKLVIAFNLPPMTVDEFFGPNLVNNLAAFLKIPSSKIRITKIIRESRRRRRRSTGQMSVLVEIADPPSKDINNSTNTTGQLQFSDIQSIADNIGQAVIAGNISASIGVNVSSMEMSTPIPPPWDPESEKVSIPEDRTPVQPNVLATVSRLVVIMEPVAGLPGELLTQQPVIMAADSTGNCVSVGVTALTLTATLMYENNTAAPDGLSGNMTIAFSNCWANYTDLVLELAGTGFKMEFVLNDVISQTRSFASQKSPEPNTTSNTTNTTSSTSSITSSTTSTQSSASTATTTTTKAAAVDPNHGTSLASNTVFQKMALMLGFLLGRQLLLDICIAVTVVTVLSMTVGGY
ncbi:fibrocystin-L-like [Ambystoma mexicanum]|uniref:fibrocystin-L-like n=1 Tax=Ambystoma mexicanum TaxID=8296 RepID=UPI0037E916E6